MYKNIEDIILWWKKYKIKAILLMLFNIVLMFGIVSGAIAYFINRPIIIEKTVDDAQVILVDGARIFVLYQIDDSITCPVSTSRYLWTWFQLTPTKKVKVKIQINSPDVLLSNISEKEYIISFPKPAGIWTGDWYYYSNTVEKCPLLKGLFKQKIKQSYDLPIKIQGDGEAPDMSDIIRVPTL